MTGSFDRWRDVNPEFTDWVRDTAARDFDGAAGLHYQDRSGRNDLAACKVARDEHNVYFYARTREPLTPPSGTNWMWLLLDTDQNPSTGWEGYDFIVNRSIEPGGKAWLERHESGWGWKQVAWVDYRVEDRQLQLTLPRAALGLPEGTTRLNLDFKWVDNARQPGDIMDFYVSGDAAPEGRFNYRFTGD